MSRHLYRRSLFVARLVVLVVVLCCVCGLVCVGSAGAFVVHSFVGPQLTEVPVGGSGVSFAGPLRDVDAMSVFGGDLWVTETVAGPSRVDEWDAESGAFVKQLPADGEVESLRYGIGVEEVGSEQQVFVGGHLPGGQAGAVAVYCAGVPCGVWKGEAVPGGKFGTQEGSVAGLAVDHSTAIGDWASGDVYVSDVLSGAVYVFRPEAGGKEKYVAAIEGLDEPGALAVDEVDGDVFVGEVGADDVKVFEPEALVEGSYKLVATIAGTSSGPFREITGVAVDGTAEDVYVADRLFDKPGRVDEFSIRKGYAYVGKIGGTGVSGEAGDPGVFENVASVAVDPAGTARRVFVGDKREDVFGSPGVVDGFGPDVVVPDVRALAASGVKLLSGVLNGEVDALEGETGEAAVCWFAWGTSEALGNESRCSHGVTGSVLQPVSVGLEGVLEPDTKYFYRVEASNGKGVDPGEEPTASCEGVPSVDACFTTPGPGLHGWWSTEVSSGAALLHGVVDPHGAPASVFFEYGTGVGYGSRTVSVPVGSGGVDVPVETQVDGLLAGSVYHFRVVVESLVEGREQVFPGPDVTFTTQPAASSSSSVLLDGREWELVSPVDKHGGLIRGLDQGRSTPIQAAVGGGAITYEATAPVAGGAQGYTTEEQELSVRASGGGWRTCDLTPAESTPQGVGVTEPQFFLFSSDLSAGLYEQRTLNGALLSQEASERTPYLWNGAACGTSTTEAFEPLVTGRQPFSDVRAGVAIDEPSKVKGGENNLPKAVAGNASLSAVVVRSSAGLTSGEAEGKQALYEWWRERPYSERLELISVLPAGEGATLAPGPVDVGADAVPNFVSDGLDDVSADGTRVYWTDGSGLYLHDSLAVRGGTLRIEGGAGHPESATFMQAQPAIEGPSRVSRVLFTESNAHAEHELFECEIVDEAGVDHCNAIDLTPPHDGEGAEVLKQILGASENLATVYYAANGVQGQGGKRGNCETGITQEGKTCGIYVYHDGETRRVATATGEDDCDWEGCLGSHQLAGRTAAVSPDGEYVAFMSSSSLTGYDNLDAVSGKPDEEVYIYDAGTGRLACASCDPTGARPHGIENGSSNAEQRLTSTRPWSPTTWIAANIPGATQVGFFGEALYQSRLLSDEGRLFFNSYDALSPRDINGNADVYEYEPPGVGSCGVQAPSYSARDEGCVGLISSGSAPGESGFLDASENGDDVFFLTQGKLVREDTDTAYDVYDAHVCTSASPCTSEAASPPPACASASECRAAQTPQPEVFAAPASATFTGAGNPTPNTAPTTKTVVKSKPKSAAKRKQCGARAAKRHVKCSGRAHKTKTKKTNKAKRAENANGKGRK